MSSRNQKNQKVKDLLNHLIDFVRRYRQPCDWLFLIHYISDMMDQAQQVTQLPEIHFFHSGHTPNIMFEVKDLW
jgi:hypothetical protein